MVNKLALISSNMSVVHHGQMAMGTKTDFGGDLAREARGDSEASALFWFSNTRSLGNQATLNLELNTHNDRILRSSIRSSSIEALETLNELPEE